MVSYDVGSMMFVDMPGGGEQELAADEDVVDAEVDSDGAKSEEWYMCVGDDTDGAGSPTNLPRGGGITAFGLSLLRMYPSDEWFTCWCWLGPRMGLVGTENDKPCWGYGIRLTIDLSSIIIGACCGSRCGGCIICCCCCC